MKRFYTLIASLLTFAGVVAVSKLGFIDIIRWIQELSSRDAKTDITEIDAETVVEKLNLLPLCTWKYRGDPITHLGPTAQDFHRLLGVGDGKTIHMVDVMGVLVAVAKVNAKHHTA